MTKLILFVCTGNTCRSPMAEGIARHWVENNQVEGWEVMSAGTFAGEGYQTSPNTVAALKDHGIDFKGVSKALSKEMIDRAAAVLCMSSTHCMDVASIAEDPKKIEMINPYGDIVDPIGGDQSVYDELALTLLELIPKRVLEITKRPAYTEE